MSAPLVGRVLRDALEDAPPRSRDGLRAVLVVLADHANDHGLAWPSVATIAQLALRSPRQVKRLLGQLEELGRLEAVRGRAGGRARSTCWRVMPHAPVSALAPRRKGDTSAPLPPAERVTRAPAKGDTAMSPEPSTPRTSPPYPPAQRGGETIGGEPPRAPSLPGLEAGAEELPALGTPRERGASPRQQRERERRARLEADRLARSAAAAEEEARRSDPAYQQQLRAAREAALARFPSLARRHAGG